MTRKEQTKILDAKIESNVNQYKVDRLNAEISAFSSGDLNKYEFLKRIDLNYKPNALDKSRFNFCPLGRAFNEGLDKTIPNYQEEGVIKLLKEIRDNLAGLTMPPGPLSSPSVPPSSPGSPPGPPSSPSLPPSSPGSSTSSSLTNVTPLPPPGPSRKTRTVRPRPKLSLSDGQKFLDQLQLETSQRPKSPPVIPIMSKIPISKRSQSPDLDDVIKEFDEQNKKNDLDAIKKITGRNEKFIEQNKLLKKIEQDKLTELLEKQRDELNKLLENTRNKQEEDIDWDIINELNRKVNELTENINSRSPTNLRTFTPRRDPFDDINKNKEKLTPPLSKIPAPIPKSREPQAVAVGEQAGIKIMKYELKTLEDYIGYFKKKLNNTEFFSKKALEINNRSIQTENRARELDKEIREREEDLERRFRKYYPDKYCPYEK